MATRSGRGVRIEELTGASLCNDKEVHDFFVRGSVAEQAEMDKVIRTMDMRAIYGKFAHEPEICNFSGQILFERHLRHGGFYAEAGMNILKILVGEYLVAEELRARGASGGEGGYYARIREVVNHATYTRASSDKFPANFDQIKKTSPLYMYNIEATVSDPHCMAGVFVLDETDRRVALINTGADSDARSPIIVYRRVERLDTAEQIQRRANELVGTMNAMSRINILQSVQRLSVVGACSNIFAREIKIIEYARYTSSQTLGEQQAEGDVPYKVNARRCDPADVGPVAVPDVPFQLGGTCVLYSTLYMFGYALALLDTENWLSMKRLWQFLRRAATYFVVMPMFEPRGYSTDGNPEVIMFHMMVSGMFPEYHNAEFSWPDYGSGGAVERLTRVTTKTYCASVLDFISRHGPAKLKGGECHVSDSTETTRSNVVAVAQDALPSYSRDDLLLNVATRFKYHRAGVLPAGGSTLADDAASLCVTAGFSLGRWLALRQIVRYMYVNDMPFRFSTVETMLSENGLHAVLEKYPVMMHGVEEFLMMLFHIIFLGIKDHVMPLTQSDLLVGDINTWSNGTLDYDNAITLETIWPDYNDDPPDVLAKSTGAGAQSALPSTRAELPAGSSSASNPGHGNPSAADAVIDMHACMARFKEEIKYIPLFVDDDGNLAIYNVTDKAMLSASGPVGYNFRFGVAILTWFSVIKTSQNLGMLSFKFNLVQSAGTMTMFRQLCVWRETVLSERDATAKLRTWTVKPRTNMLGLALCSPGCDVIELEKIFQTQLADASKDVWTPMLPLMRYVRPRDQVASASGTMSGGTSYRDRLLIDDISGPVISPIYDELLAMRRMVRFIIGDAASVEALAKWNNTPLARLLTLAYGIIPEAELRSNAPLVSLVKRLARHASIAVGIAPVTGSGKKSDDRGEIDAVAIAFDAFLKGDAFSNQLLQLMHGAFSSKTLPMFVAFWLGRQGHSDAVGGYLTPKFEQLVNESSVLLLSPSRIVREFSKLAIDIGVPGYADALSAGYKLKAHPQVIELTIGSRYVFSLSRYSMKHNICVFRDQGMPTQVRAMLGAGFEALDITDETLRIRMMYGLVLCKTYDDASRHPGTEDVKRERPTGQSSAVQRIVIADGRAELIPTVNIENVLLGTRKDPNLLILMMDMIQIYNLMFNHMCGWTAKRPEYPVPDVIIPTEMKPRIHFRLADDCRAGKPDPVFNSYIMVTDSAEYRVVRNYMPDTLIAAGTITSDEPVCSAVYSRWFSNARSSATLYNAATDTYHVIKVVGTVQRRAADNPWGTYNFYSQTNGYHIIDIHNNGLWLLPSPDERSFKQLESSETVVDQFAQMHYGLDSFGPLLTSYSAALIAAPIPDVRETAITRPSFLEKIRASIAAVSSKIYSSCKSAPICSSGGVFVANYKGCCLSLPISAPDTTAAAGRVTKTQGQPAAAGSSSETKYLMQQQHDITIADITGLIQSLNGVADMLTDYITRPSVQDHISLSVMRILNPLAADYLRRIPAADGTAFVPRRPGDSCIDKELLRPLFARNAHVQCAAELIFTYGLPIREWCYAMMALPLLNETISRLASIVSSLEPRSSGTAAPAPVPATATAKRRSAVKRQAGPSGSQAGEALSDAYKRLESGEKVPAISYRDVMYAIELFDENVVGYEDVTMVDMLTEIVSGYLIRTDQQKLTREIVKSYGDAHANSVVRRMIMGGGKSSFVTPWLIFHHVLKPTAPALAFVVVPEALFEQTLDSVYSATRIFGTSCMPVRILGASDRKDVIFKEFGKPGAELDRGVVVSSDKMAQRSMLFNVSNNTPQAFLREACMIFDEVDLMTDPLKCEMNVPISDVHNLDSDVPIAILFGLDGMADALMGPTSGLDIDKHIQRLPALVAKYRGILADATSPDPKTFVYNKTFGFGAEMDVSSGNKLNHLIAIPFSAANTPMNGSRFTDYEIAFVLTYVCYKKLIIHGSAALRLCDIEALAAVASEHGNLQAFANTVLGPVFPRDLRDAFCTMFAKPDPAEKQDSRATFLRLYAQHDTPTMRRAFFGTFFTTVVRKYLSYTDKQLNVGMLEIMSPNISTRRAMFSGTLGIHTHVSDPDVFTLETLLNGGPHLPIRQLDPPTDDPQLYKESAYMRSMMSGFECVPARFLGMMPAIIAAKAPSDMHLLSTFLSGDKMRYTALIDSAGLLRNYATSVYARIIAVFKPAAPVCYVDHGVRTIVTCPNDYGKTYLPDPASLSNMVAQLAKQTLGIVFETVPYIGATRLAVAKNAVFLYDQANTVGTDFKQPSVVHGLLSIDASTTYTTAVQAAFRLRRLARGHSYDYYICSPSGVSSPKDVVEKILLPCEQSDLARKLPNSRIATVLAMFRAHPKTFFQHGLFVNNVFIDTVAALAYKPRPLSANAEQDGKQNAEVVATAAVIDGIMGGLKRIFVRGAPIPTKQSGRMDKAQPPPVEQYTAAMSDEIMMAHIRTNVADMMRVLTTLFTDAAVARAEKILCENMHQVHAMASEFAPKIEISIALRTETEKSTATTTKQKTQSIGYITPSLPVANFYLADALFSVRYSESVASIPEQYQWLGAYRAAAAGIYGINVSPGADAQLLYEYQRLVVHGDNDGTAHTYPFALLAVASGPWMTGDTRLTGRLTLHLINDYDALNIMGTPRRVALGRKFPSFAVYAPDGRKLFGFGAPLPYLPENLLQLGSITPSLPSTAPASSSIVPEPITVAQILSDVLRSFGTLGRLDRPYGSVAIAKDMLPDHLAAIFPRAYSRSPGRAVASDSGSHFVTVTASMGQSAALQLPSGDSDNTPIKIQTEFSESDVHKYCARHSESGIPRACAVCGSRDNLGVCSHCGLVAYCSVEHQREHAPLHLFL